MVKRKSFIMDGFITIISFDTEVGRGVIFGHLGTLVRSDAKVSRMEQKYGTKWLNAETLAPNFKKNKLILL